MPGPSGMSASPAPRSRSPPAVTALQARTFAVWTLTSAVVRAYAAYNINNKMSVIPPSSNARRSPLASIYDMAFLTYLIAFAHFSSELLIFRTASINVAVLSPVIVSSMSIPEESLSCFLTYPPI